MTYFSSALSGFPRMFSIVFVLIVGVFVYVIVKNVAHSAKNKQSPVLSVAARIVAKRQHTWGGSGDAAAHTDYFATFEVQSGDRMELSVPADQIGYLAEGDVGMLTFQGDSFVSFERT